MRHVVTLVSLCHGWAWDEIVGVSDDELRSKLIAVSKLIGEAGRPPPTIMARRRVEADLLLLKEALASLGCYGAKVVYEVDSTKSPVRVTLRVELPLRELGPHPSASD